MKNSVGLVTGLVHDADRTIRIPTKDHTFTSIDCDVLVFWKGKFHRIRSAEIGDGMELVVVCERGAYRPLSLDNESVRVGLSIYHEFDEKTSTSNVYLFNFPKNPEALSRLNNHLSHHAIGMQAERQGKFITLGALSEKPSEIISPLLSQKLGEADDGVVKALSFVYGAFLGYGQRVDDDESIHHALINLPLVGSITQSLELFEGMCQQLATVGIFIRSASINTKFGQMLQLDIYDWEVLTCFADRSQTNKTILKYQQLAERTDQISPFLKDPARTNGNQTPINTKEKSIEGSKLVYKFCKC